MSQITGGITLLDLAKKRNSAGDPYEDIIDETVKAIPEVSGFSFNTLTGERRPLPGVGSAAPIEGMSYDSLVRSALPDVDFRDTTKAVI